MTTVRFHCVRPDPGPDVDMEVVLPTVPDKGEMIYFPAIDGRFIVEVRDWIVDDLEPMALITLVEVVNPYEEGSDEADTRTG